MGISCPCNASQVHFVLLARLLNGTNDGAVSSVLVHDLLDFFVLHFLLFYDLLGCEEIVADYGWLNPGKVEHFHLQFGVGAVESLWAF